MEDKLIFLDGACFGLSDSIGWFDSWCPLKI